ncbi:MAG TPA: hypothetical protein VE999_19510 [Gemmataceae bacterium]|nr:hypothetical protein [Gemmataceae bacterium]
MFETDTDMPTAIPSSAFDDAIALIKLAADPKAFQARLNELTAAGTKAREEKAAAVKAQSELAARVAELDKREASLDALRSQLSDKSDFVEERHAELKTVAASLRKLETTLKMRILNHAGALEGFDPKLQSLPDWAEIDAEIGIPRDPHFDEPIALDPGGVEPVSYAAAGVTLTRSTPERRSMRRG